MKKIIIPRTSRLNCFISHFGIYFFGVIPPLLLLNELFLIKTNICFESSWKGGTGLYAVSFVFFIFYFLRDEKQKDTCCHPLPGPSGGFTEFEN